MFKSREVIRLQLYKRGLAELKLLVIYQHEVHPGSDFGSSVVGVHCVNIHHGGGLVRLKSRGLEILIENPLQNFLDFLLVILKVENCLETFDIILHLVVYLC